MATACTYCGQDLPKDDAHFCNNCGMLVPSHPFSAQSLAASSDSASQPREQEKPVLREQMVHRPMQKPVTQEPATQRPRTTRRIAPDNSSVSPVAWPAPLTHVSIKDASPQKNYEQEVQQEQQPVQSEAQRPTFAERELHVKVWDSPTPLPESRIEEEAQSDIEDTPTTPLVASEQTKIEDEPVQNETDEYHDDVEHLDTMPMPNNHAPVPQQAPSSAQSLHGNTPLPYSSMQQQPTRMAQPSQSPNVQVSMAPTQERSGVSAPSAVSATPRRHKSRVPFIILLALLGLLVLGGGAWAILAQPFGISPVTQPLQDFKDTQLGVAFSYPNSWSTQHNATGVLFADSSHTAQVKLTVADSTSDAAQYVQQQATKNGMTGIKPLGTRSFAGTSWQQIQGNMQQDGANYTTTMLATVHDNRMYVLTQMAPQNVYADEDNVVFSAVRNSFKFL